MKKIAIICKLDGFANSIVPVEIKKFLEKKGHSVMLLNTHYISRFNKKTYIPHATPQSKGKIFILIILETINYVFQTWGGKINYFLLLMSLKIRDSILKDYFMINKFDIIICENSTDSYFLLNQLAAVKIYHCPTPYAEELYSGGQISKKDYEKFKSIEVKIYKNVNHLAFHWESYTKYVKKYIYTGDNLFKLNWGCSVSDIRKKAKYSKNAKIIFLGYLGGKWVNKPLLSKLTKQYKQIDVYGAPPPEAIYGLNYKGYLSKTDIIRNYQFGLITISKDKLRQNGFSAKHLEYLSFGLPVLVPEWRKDPVLDDVSIYYNEKNFLNVLKEYSKKENWDRISNKCYSRAKQLQWKNVLKPLITIIDKYK